MSKYLTVLIAATIFGCASQESAPPPTLPTSNESLQKPQPTFLTHEELKALFSGTLTVHAAGYGLRGRSTFQKDGTARFEAPMGVQVGSWHIDGNKFCSSYSRVGAGCSNLEKTGTSTYTLYPTDGKAGSTWEVMK